MLQIAFVCAKKIAGSSWSVSDVSLLPHRSSDKIDANDVDDQVPVDLSMNDLFACHINKDNVNESLRFAECKL
jgi:hypothetical protein